MGLVVGGNYKYIVMLMGFGGAKRWGDALKSLFGVAMQATRRENFYGKEGL